MPTEIMIPRLGWSMDEGVFSEWLKPAGELVSAGEMLFILEGDKAAHEVESFDAGILCIPSDAPQPGDAVRVGQVIGFLLAAGEDAPTTVRGAGMARLRVVTSAPPDFAATAPRVAGPATGVLSIATPRARRRAKELGIDWQSIPGTGREGRVRERDVLAHSTRDTTSSAAPPPPAPGSYHPASRIRLTLAQRMLAGVQQTAPVTLTTKVDAGAMVALRQQWRADENVQTVPSYTDMLVKLAAVALKEMPQLNACWHADGIWTYDVIHIAVAVDTESGLMAPVISDADKLSLAQIAERSRELIAQARAGTLTQSQLQGGTFTVTNLGMYGIDAFTPVLNLPQAAILGVGRIVKEPVVRGDAVVVGETLSLSLTFDHRVVDGAPAARWLQRLTQLIQCAGDTLRNRPS